MLAGVTALLCPSSASADQAAVKAQQGMMWFRWKKCGKAVPLLEEAELLRHQAHAALALADCYVEAGKLVEAVEIYRAVAQEKITNRTLYQDRIAIQKAAKRLEEAEARIPTIAFEPSAPYEGLEVFVDGKPMDDPKQPRQVKPGETIVIVARAKGHEELRDEVSLAEGEHLIRPLKLAKAVQAKKPKRRPEHKAEADSGPGNRTWFGMRGRGYVIPSFAWRVFGEGGRTVLVPGAALSLTSETSDADLSFTLGYASYGVGPTPFKNKNAPDTDWEIIESDMHAAYATAELAWRDRLDDKGAWEFFWGGGVGIGWTFAGNLKRTQAYPPSLQPGDPYTYRKCKGPNDPPGSYVYCNELDHDADHYEYNEPSWFVGGRRPLVYPWLAFPQIGFTYKPSPATALDLELGLTTSGLLVGLGVRGR